MRLREAFWTSDFRIRSPALGQGMNTGIQDAVNLAWKLAHVACGADPALVDHRGEVEARYGKRPALYLVRPDGYLAFSGPPEEVHVLFTLLDRWLPPGGPTRPRA